ncbi:MAG: hypothetical protein LBG25_00150 [Spirochaetaceae bacterium]|jgi:hypothetical protein|nr:hypothetical protein [Spirochaetaceae bacterium]
MNTTFKAVLFFLVMAAFVLTGCSTDADNDNTGNNNNNNGGDSGGSNGTGGTITISGGTVTATSRGIAYWITGPSSGNAVVFTLSIWPALDNATKAIAFNGTAGTMYGSVTLQQDLTIPSTHTLDFYMGSGQTLTIPSGVTLTNEGTINKKGGTISGTVGGGGTVN